jgi:drug/metabolite transporter (DMT)-like permease
MRLNRYAVLVVGVLSVSSAAVIIRLADAPAMVIAAYRLSLATIVILPVALSRGFGSFKQIGARDWLWITLSGLFLSLHFALWITSLSYTSIASSVVLVTSHPAFVAVVSYFLWGERLRRLTLAGIVVALLGVVLINYGGFAFGSQTALGNLLALLAAFSAGAYLIVGGRLTTKVSILSYLSLVYTFSAVILLVAAVSLGHSLFGYSPKTYLMLVLLAVIPQLIGHSCLNYAVRLMPVTLVSVTILGEPVGATLLGYIVLDEAPAVNEILGGLLILSGIFLVMRYRPESPAKDNSTTGLSGSR